MGLTADDELSRHETGPVCPRHDIAYTMPSEYFGEENLYSHVQNHHTQSLELCTFTLVLAYF